MPGTSENSGALNSINYKIPAKLRLTVFGATGHQGGSVINTIISHETLATKYRLRAVTRDVAIKSAMELAACGCEVVKADMYNVASLRAAVEGSYAVFAMTNYYDPTVTSQENEVRQGKKRSRRMQIGWRTPPHLLYRPSGSKTSQGSLTNLQHFDSKAEISDYIEEI
jgi:hypothetical protein